MFKNQTDFYKDSCYFFAPDYYLHLHPNDYVGAVSWCHTAENGFILRCLSGVGSRTIKQNIGSPGFVESVCMHGKTIQQINSCIDGMVSYFLVNYDSVSRANELCGDLKKENQATCFASVNSRSKLFLN